MTRWTPPALLLALLLPLTACSSGSGGGAGNDGPVLRSGTLEQQLTADLTKKAGQAPDDVACPGDLSGEQGTTVRCTLTDGSQQLGVTVTSTGTAEGEVTFRYEVDQQPLPSGS